jgi:tRNA (guanine37-N1)-methyltransferase
MLTFHIITLFPELIELYCRASILGRGQTAERIAVKTYNPRDFCLDKYRKVDDTPYGGGAGMVMKPEPLFATFESITRQADSPVILTSPRGGRFDQAAAERLSKNTDITIICGHYEGVDERVVSIVTEEISVGDFVLTGGELPTLAIIDAVGRLIPGVLGKSHSLTEESFNEGLLEAPHYTKPPSFRGLDVPAVLLSGNHKLIAEWRRQEALRLTFERRPDLLAKLELNAVDRKFLNSLKPREKTI